MPVEGPGGVPGPSREGGAPTWEGGGAQHGGVEVVANGDTVSVRFWGAVDLAVRLAATTELRAMPAGVATVRVDCRDVTFMDSTGLSVVVRVVRDAAADGRSVRLVGAARPVAELFATTGVDRWMESLGVRPGS
ncbi:hypothetical protein GCM10009866_14400 [Cellulomonas aerilata]